MSTNGHPFNATADSIVAGIDNGYADSCQLDPETYEGFADAFDRLAADAEEMPNLDSDVFGWDNELSRFIGQDGEDVGEYIGEPYGRLCGDAESVFHGYNLDASKFLMWTFLHVARSEHWIREDAEVYEDELREYFDELLSEAIARGEVVPDDKSASEKDAPKGGDC